jgi:protein-S-isoprenylcysteine O-methyltransferase Ste14
MTTATTTVRLPRRFSTLLKPGNLLPASVWLFLIYMGLNTPFPPSLSVSGLILINSVVLVFLMIRRDPAKLGSKSDLVIALAGTFIVTLLLGSEPLNNVEIFPTTLQIVGLVGWGWSLSTLGRSFGIVAADRGLVQQGPYRFVRHPIYAFEMLFFLGYLAAAPTPKSAVIIGVWIILQCLRIIREERIIEGYETYTNNVRWRLIPFVW